MREKLRLSDLNVLYACSDWGHGTTGHRVLADAITFRNAGGNPLLICLKGSVLDREAEKQDIRRVHLEASAGWRFHRPLWRLIAQLLKGAQVDLIHCYSYDMLAVFGLALRREVRVPLIYTCNEDLAERYRPFWHDFFIRRIDHVLCFSPSIGEQVSQVLRMGARKVGFTGAGLEPPRTQIKAPSESPWRICTYVKPDEADVERFVPVFLALPLLERDGKRVILSLATRGSWYEHPHYELFKRTILERGLEHHVTFHPQSWGSGALAGQHLYVGLESLSPFEDHELEALFNQVPLLLPRTAARTQLLAGGRLGLTYLPGDVRELKVKAQKILESREGYRLSIEKALPELAENHHFERYIDELFQLYERLSLQRLRFSLKRRSPFVSRT